MSKRIDLHVHLAGTGQGGTGCRVSDKMARSLHFAVLTRVLGMSRRDPDRRYADRLVDLVDSATEVDFACVFALDGVYDAQGEFRPDQSHLFVPNSYVVEVCRRSPRLLPVISINPQRKDALGELERWGPQAVALKWLPPLQRFDPSDARFDSFRRLVRELGLPVICHSGTEHTFPGVVQRLGDPELCSPLLKLGIPVVFAHCGTCSLLTPHLNFVPGFHRMLERFDCAFGDTSGFVSIFRAGRVKEFSADRYAGRVFQGSDFPVPLSAVYYVREFGIKGVRELDAIANPLDRDVAIKRAAGMPDPVFTGAFDLLERRIRAVKGS